MIIDLVGGPRCGDRYDVKDDYEVFFVARPVEVELYEDSDDPIPMTRMDRLVYKRCCCAGCQCPGHDEMVSFLFDGWE